MKKLLEDTIAAIEERMWDRVHTVAGRIEYPCSGCGRSMHGGEHAAHCRWPPILDRLRAALSAYEPDPNPAAVILAMVDQLEETEPEKAARVRAALFEMECERCGKKCRSGVLGIRDGSRAILCVECARANPPRPGAASRVMEAAEPIQEGDLVPRSASGSK